MYCVQLVEKSDSFKYTREILQTLDQQVREEVIKIGANNHMDDLLNELLY